MTARPLVILASARKQSDTRNFVDKAFTNINHQLIDLLDVHISNYDYSENYPENDNFLEVAAEMLKHQVIVFATPVYWYAMSGLMKTFFDRFTDLTTSRKQLGRQLQGKKTFLIAVGADNKLPSGFEIPFSLTSKYLGLSYKGGIYFSTKTVGISPDFQKKLKTFTDNIEKYS